MKLFKYLLLCVILISSACSSVIPIVYAQSFPVTRFAEWDINAPEDAVEFYSFHVDNEAIVKVPFNEVNVGCNCYRIQFTMTTSGIHTVHVTATNQFGESPELTASINVQMARVKSLRITK